MLAAHAPRWPIESTPFIGRDDEILALDELAQRSSFITVTGAYGVGKTRLVLHWLRAHQASSTTQRFACRGLRDAAFSTLLGEHEEHVQHALQQGGIIYLDGIDDAHDAVQSQVSAWLSHYAHARVIVTSAVQLRLVAESVLHLGPLRTHVRDGETQSPALCLYYERCRAADAEFRAPEALDGVTQLVEATHGLPLLLELLAQRSTSMGPQALLRESDAWLDLLVTNQLDRETTQRSVRAELNRLYDTLTPTQQQLWQQCATFAQSFTNEAVSAAVGTEPQGPPVSSTEVGLVLEALLERSLITKVAPTQTVPADPPRLMVMKHLRQFALERAQVEGRSGVLHRRHAAWVSGLARTALENGDDSQLWVDLAELELALRRQAELPLSNALELATCVLRVLTVRGSSSAFERVETAIVAAIKRASPNADAKSQELGCEVALLAARTYLRYGSPDGASHLLDDSLDLITHVVRSGENAFMAAEWWQVNAAVARARGASKQAEEAYYNALRANGAARDTCTPPAAPGLPKDALTRCDEQRARLESQYASWLFEHDRLSESEHHFQAALALHRKAPGSFMEGVTLNNWALVLQHAEQWQRAEELVTQALSIHRTTGHQRFEAIAHADLGVIALERGYFSLAARHSGLAARRLATLGDQAHAQLADAVRLLALALAGEAAPTSSLPASIHHTGDDYRAALALAAQIYVEMAEWVRELDTNQPAARLWATLSTVDERSLVWNARTAALAARCDELRLARRVASRCHEWCCSPTDTLVVACDCTRGRMPNGEAFAFADKPALAALLRRLVSARLERERPELSLDVLVATAWPGEKISEAAAKNRLHVALSKLRKSGLGAALVTTKGGYELAADLPVLRTRARSQA